MSALFGLFKGALSAINSARRVAEVFGRVFVLAGSFIKGGYLIRAPKAQSPRGVWGHVPPEYFEI